MLANDSGLTLTQPVVPLGLGPALVRVIELSRIPVAGPGGGVDP